MSKIKASRFYTQTFSAFKVKKGEKVSIVRNGNRIRVRVGDFVITDGQGNTFAVTKTYFKAECMPVK